MKPPSLFPWPDTHEDAVELKRKHKTKPIDDMHKAWGVNLPEVCGDCVHLITLEYSHKYYKCEESRCTHGPATDWRRSWIACGRWSKRETQA